MNRDIASVALLRSHDARLRRMLADPDCVGELLLVGIGMARCVDLGDPPWTATGNMPLRVIAEQVYGRRRLTGRLLGVSSMWSRCDGDNRQRIKDVFVADRRRYDPDADEHAGRYDAVTCGRPMIRREGPCRRAASDRLRVTDPATGHRSWVGACSQAACKGWLADVVARNRAELKLNPAPVPYANTGGVLERHLPEIDWWKVWRHVDSNWSPPPEGRAFAKPRLTLLLGQDEPVVAARPALTVHEGGWR